MQHNERMREFYRDAVEVVGWLFWNSYRMALATLFVFAVVMLAGCLTADPDTATVRDFLIAVQNPSIWCSSAVIALIWTCFRVLLSPRRTYPLGVAIATLGPRKPSAPARPGRD